MNKHCLSLFLISMAAVAPLPADSPEEGFTPLFNGKDMTGWKPSESPETWSIQDGAIVAHGKRSHLFYEGDFHDHKFKDFELKVDVMTMPNSNGGIYIQTEPLASWPDKGFEIQVNNSYNSDPRRTFSIYEVEDVKEVVVPDNKWFTEDIIAKGNTITVKHDGKVMAHWAQPADWNGTKDFAGRRIGAGTIALQGHDPKSTVYYKNIRIKPLD